VPLSLAGFAQYYSDLAEPRTRTLSNSPIAAYTGS
jgi:hypothetical protein